MACVLCLESAYRHESCGGACFYMREPNRSPRTTCAILGIALMLCFGTLVIGGYSPLLIGRSIINTLQVSIFISCMIIYFILSTVNKTARHSKQKVLHICQLLNFIIQIGWSICTVLYIFIAWPSGTWWQTAYSIWSGWMMSAFLIEWNPHMTSQKPSEAHTTVLSVSLGVGVFLLVTASLQAGINQQIPAIVFSLLPGLSGVLGLSVLACRDSNSAISGASPDDQDVCSNRVISRRFFYGERLVFGILFGIAMGGALFSPSIPDHIDFGAATQLGAGLVMVAASTFAIIGKKERYVQPYLLLCLPLFIALTFLLAFDRHDLSGLAQLAVMLTWLSWYVYTYTEMPIYYWVTPRNDTSIHETPLAFGWTEKAITLVPLMTVAACAGAITDRMPIEMRHFYQIVSVLFLYSCIVVFIVRIALLLARSFPNAGGIVKRELSDKEAISAMAEHFGLTERESDVIALMCHGYTRPYIEKRLCISTGTAKTHMHHIYQKTKVQDRDGLVDLFGQFKSMERP